MNKTLPPHDEKTIISTSRLTKAFGNLVAVNDLNLEVQRGDVFGFLGPNGSGKTTTIRMLLGLIRPSAGRALLFGMDTAYQLPEILQRIGAIVEMPIFYPYLSGRDNLRVIAANSGMVLGKANEARISEILDIVELRTYEKLAYRKYSLGMKQRLGIAAALLNDPELVMLDEPTNGLDPAGVIEIRRLIQRLASLGKTVFLSSHILSEVQQVCNRVAILRKGNLVKLGAVEDLLRTDEEIEVRMNDTIQTEQALALLQELRGGAINWLTDVRIDQNKRNQSIIKLAAPNDRSAEVNQLLAQHQLYAAEIHPREGSLEEVFLQLVAPSSAAGPYIGGTMAGSNETSTAATALKGDQK
ncbi:ABC transporter ATP-binding protein [Tengunoibacter tsumagoiensis]|uniref:ABC transporter ATP-binding protein n=1 Tax=Tengunoibacter tsumagoiensis TaxID=2014871 RepID=A0A401ZWS5_9CHLR|nr:ATP-binding cassette domain-containing protein [Tengunoibacter tsumagoiensis]GCE11318.1 ABC transporter ATP-binding protein [Tengunoibacter tsumagoiensis]